MTRDEILNLKVGDKLANTMDIEPRTGFKKLKSNPQFGEARAVVSIAARGTRPDGKVYVLGYTEFGPNSEISFSVGEDELHYQKVD